MATDNNDILLDDDGEDKVKDGDFAVGDGTIDDCFIIFRLNKGMLKGNVMMGPNLQLMINDNKPPTKIKQEMSLSLEMDGKTAKKLDIVNGVLDFEI